MTFARRTRGIFVVTLLITGTSFRFVAILCAVTKDIIVRTVDGGSEFTTAINTFFVSVALNAVGTLFICGTFTAIVVNPSAEMP
jgi:hypothetical protein